MLIRRLLLLFLLLLLLQIVVVSFSQEDGLDDFVYNDGFGGSASTARNLSISEEANITGNGLLKLTPTTGLNQIGHAFYPIPLRLQSSKSSDGKSKWAVPSFSTTFVIALVPGQEGNSGNGMAFVLSPRKELAGGQPSQFLGLFNVSSNGDPSNNITAVEFDTIENTEFKDINDNHVGIDVNSLKSISSLRAGYYHDDNGGRFQNITLRDGKGLQVWVEYSGARRVLNVTIAPVKTKKPSRPLLSSAVDLTTLAYDSIYVGFSASTGTILTSHYVLGWSFKVNGEAQPLDISRLPKLPRRAKKRSKVMSCKSSPLVYDKYGMLITNCPKRNLLLMKNSVSVGNDVDFVYNGFYGSNLTLDGAAEIAGNGLLQLTNSTSQNQIGHAFFPTPLSLMRNSSDGKSITTTVSFSTTFVLAIVPKDPGLIGNGMAFVISPSKELKGSQPSQYLGLFNMSDNGDSSNNITAVEFDTITSPEFEDINDDHVGIDVNDLNSVVSVPTAYFTTSTADDDIQGAFKNLSLRGGYPLQVWVEYDGRSRTMNVTVSTVQVIRKPNVTRRLLSTSTVDLSTVNHDSLYVGFSAATGTFLTSHYVLGWSFKSNGQAARPLDIPHLPKVPRPKKKPKFIIVYGVPSLVGAFLALASNVLLDAHFNGRLGDFGLSILYDHGSDPHTTRIVGTIGYMAPELNRTGRATKATDVFSFGVFMLEVVCGRRPVDAHAQADKIVLVDWVVECFRRRGRIFEVVDDKLGRNFDTQEKEEMELVLRLGLICLNATAEERPSMERVMHFLEGVLPLPEVALDGLGLVVSPPLPLCLGGDSDQKLFMSAPPLESVSVLIIGR
ncbi:hypothetical protein H6P81_007496 [Aristolochia fimbriata]|uniref:non-specific serine/threonine protein kinase n=1 Tax=Aristolochia fimbriata TaxID=158543 RepID=A0AAV7F490_ARIFI|nr:hypothetical protein H6P81_007496 [Aristolochia fimbriata]